MIPRMKNSLTVSLNALREECREANWDGYGAEAVNPLALKRAEDVIASLPDDLPLPECSFEPGGCVSLDWMPAAHRILTVSVSVRWRDARGRLAHSGIARVPADTMIER